MRFPAGSPGRCAARLFLPFLLASVLAPGCRAADNTAELMAAFVFNFTRFVDWPAATLPTPQTPISLCVSSAELLEGQLLRIHGRQARNRRLMVQVVSDVAELPSCHLLFVPKEDPAIRSDWLARVAGQPVLTISDAPRDAPGSPLITLYVERGHVRFAIDRPAALASGLRLNPRLLALSRDAAGGEP